MDQKNLRPDVRTDVVFGFIAFGGVLIAGQCDSSRRFSHAQFGSD